MPRKFRHLKHALAALTPISLFVLLVLQLFYHKWSLITRNHYLVESLPVSSAWVWDSLSGNTNVAADALSGSNEHAVPPKKLAKALQTSSDAIKTNNVQGENLNTVLIPGLPSLSIHYIWCIDGHFELSHYLSIRSILSQLKPDSVVIHYRVKPRSDPKGYWRWLEDLQRDVILLTIKPLSNPHVCSDTSTLGIERDSSDFPDQHGVFILSNVALYNLTRASLVKKLQQSYSVTAESVKPLDHSQVFIVGGSEPFQNKQGPGHLVIKCTPVVEFNQKVSLENVTCIDMNTYFSPDDIYNRDTRFYDYARTVLFNSPLPIEVRTGLEEGIPKFVHIILNKGSEISPMLYVSIKSAYIYGLADQVFLHGPQKPLGDLWTKLLENDQTKPQYIPTADFQEMSTKNGDFVYALYNLLLHGGLTHFGDVVFIKPLPSSVLTSPAVSTRTYTQYREPHRLINTAILAAEKGSDFIESLLAMVKQAALAWPEATVDNMATHIEEVSPTHVLLDGSLTSHQKCSSSLCQVAGGHAHPDDTYTTRLLWSGGQPHSLEDLKAVEGPTRNLVADLIDKPGTQP